MEGPSRWQSTQCRVCGFKIPVQVNTSDALLSRVSLRDIASVVFQQEETFTKIWKRMRKQAPLSPYWVPSKKIHMVTVKEFELMFSEIRKHSAGIVAPSEVDADAQTLWVAVVARVLAADSPSQITIQQLFALRDQILQQNLQHVSEQLPVPPPKKKPSLPYSLEQIAQASLSIFRLAQIDTDLDIRTHENDGVVVHTKTPFGSTVLGEGWQEPKMEVTCLGTIIARVLVELANPHNPYVMTKSAFRELDFVTQANLQRCSLSVAYMELRARARAMDTFAEAMQKQTAAQLHRTPGVVHGLYRDRQVASSADAVHASIAAAGLRFDIYDAYMRAVHGSCVYEQSPFENAVAEKAFWDDLPIIPTGRPLKDHMDEMDKVNSWGMRCVCVLSLTPAVCTQTKVSTRHITFYWNSSMVEWYADCLDCPTAQRDFYKVAFSCTERGGGYKRQKFWQQCEGFDLDTPRALP
jgi:hypothetical protein